MKLLAGLGNPGTEYKNNRHNVGFMAADRFAGRVASKTGAKSVKFERKYMGKFAVVEFPYNDRTGILKPTTFMNRSGRSVGQAVREARIDIGDILAVHDDLDLPLGKIRVKYGGGAGGHNGIKNIADALGTQDFARLRIGIGRPSGGDTSDYVLSDFTPSEVVILENEIMPRVVDAVIAILEKGVEAAMNEFNGLTL